MARIDKIISVVQSTSSRGDSYFVTYALVDGDEVTGWGKDYKVGEEVEKFYDDRYNRAKMRKLGIKKP